METLNEMLKKLVQKVDPALQVFVDEQKSLNPMALYFLLGVIDEIDYEVSAYEEWEKSGGTTGNWALNLKISNENGELYYEEPIGVVKAEDIPDFLWNESAGPKKRKHLVSWGSNHPRCGGEKYYGRTIIKGSKGTGMPKCKRCIKHAERHKLKIGGGFLDAE